MDRSTLNRASGSEDARVHEKIRIYFNGVGCGIKTVTSTREG
jgi:hypothetical protein